MNIRHALIVFRKEISDIIRDRRTLITTLLMPMLLMPILFYFMGSSIENMEKNIVGGDGGSARTSIGITARADTPAVRELLTRMLAGIDNVDLVLDSDLALLKDEKVPAVLDVPGDADAIVARGEPLKVDVIYDESKISSSGSANRIASAISDNADAVLREKLHSMGIELDDLKPAEPSMKSIASVSEDAPQTGAGNPFISMMLPMMLSILLWSGAIGASTDMVAGEKERFTLEPLLATCANRMAILAGKMLAVMAFMLVSLLSTLLGMGLAFAISPALLAVYGGSMSLALPPATAALVLLNVVMLGMTFISIQITLSTMARSMKQAQQWLSLLMLAVMAPAFSTMFLQAGDVSVAMMFVPVLNTIAAMKMALGGVLRYDLMLISLASAAVYMAAALMVTVKMFGRESVLFRA